MLLALVVVPGYWASAQGISTGPVPSQSSTRSRYFLGLSADSNALLSRLKITGLQRLSDGSLSAQIIALDSEGNLLPTSVIAAKLNASIACRGQSPVSFAADLESSSNTPKSLGSGVYVAIDNSLLAGTTARDVILSLKGALAGTCSLDSMGIGIFNQSLKTIQRVGPIQRTVENVSLDDLPTPSGISALYSAMSSAASELQVVDGARSLIIVTSTGDNASPMSNTREIAKLLQDYGIKLHVVRIGYDLDTHPLRYIASTTGGTVYTVEESEKETIGDIVRELIYSERWNSSFTMPLGIEDVVDCESRWLRLHIPGDSLQPAITDSIQLAYRELEVATSPALVALFDEGSNIDLQPYQALLMSLAERLSEDINLRIELIGHANSDVDDNEAEKLGLERARSIKQILVANGALDKQIALRSAGNRKPMFYFTDDATRRIMNNRVEAVITPAEQRPYTIIVDQVPSEDEAQRRASEWTKREFKAFYEPVIVKAQSAYRIVLWGFNSRALAESSAIKIRKQYRPPYTIIE